MKKLFFSLLLSTLLFSCIRTRPYDESQIDCSKIQCFAFLSHFDFRVVDKTNGNDLVFGANPRYLASEIKLYYDAARTLPVQINTDNTGMKFTTLFSREEMYLEIKGTDVYKLTTEYREVDCCSNRVKTLRVDEILVCSGCPDIIPVPVN